MAIRIRKMAIENGAVEMVTLPAAVIADYADKLKIIKFTGAK